MQDVTHPHHPHQHRVWVVPDTTLGRWADAVGWEPLLNRAGTTFKKLPDVDKVGVDRAMAIALMVAHPSMIKRPVVEGEGKLLVGFKPDDWATAFG